MCSGQRSSAEPGGKGRAEPLDVNGCRRHGRLSILSPRNGASGPCPWALGWDPLGSCECNGCAPVERLESSTSCERHLGVSSGPTLLSGPGGWRRRLPPNMGFPVAPGGVIAEPSDGGWGGGPSIPGRLSLSWARGGDPRSPGRKSLPGASSPTSKCPCEGLAPREACWPWSLEAFDLKPSSSGPEGQLEDDWWSPQGLRPLCSGAPLKFTLPPHREPRARCDLPSPNSPSALLKLWSVWIGNSTKSITVENDAPQKRRGRGGGGEKQTTA